MMAFDSAIHHRQSIRLNHDKITVLCSRNCPPDVLQAATNRAQNASPQYCFMSGFHSPPEKAILGAVLRSVGDTHVAHTRPAQGQGKGVPA